MPRSDFNGSWTALITPFRDDGIIDYEGLEKNVQFQVDQGITGILAVGTTGESPTLSNREHIEVIAQANKFAGKKCGVLAGTGSNCTSEALDHCAQRGLMPQMNIMSGDDDKTYEMMTKGSILAQGVISVVTNIAPKAVIEMVDALRKGGSGDADTRALALVKKLKPLFSIVTVKAKSERTLPDGKKIVVEDRFRNPLATKTLMNALGMPAGPTRQPMGKINREGLAVVRNAVIEVFENSPEILEPIAQFYGIDLEERINDDSYWKPLMYS